MFLNAYSGKIDNQVNTYACTQLVKHAGLPGRNALRAIVTVMTALAPVAAATDTSAQRTFRRT